MPFKYKSELKMLKDRTDNEEKSAMKEKLRKLL